jgi:hypothetical protein
MMPITSESELKTKIQTIAATKAAYRSTAIQADVATMLRAEVSDLESASADASLISMTNGYLSRVETHYSQSINKLT